jgi:hypothetical protein
MLFGGRICQIPNSPGTTRVHVNPAVLIYTLKVIRTKF